MKLDRTYNAEMEETQKKLSDSLKVGLHKYLMKKKEEKTEKSEKESIEEKSSEEKNEKREVEDDLESGKR